MSDRQQDTAYKMKKEKDAISRSVTDKNIQQQYFKTGESFKVKEENKDAVSVAPSNNSRYTTGH